MLKAVLENELIMEKIISSLQKKESVNVKESAIRLIFNLLPGLNHDILKTETLISEFFKLSSQATEALSSYCIGLLSVIMKSSEISSNYKDKNANLVQRLVQSLRDIILKYFSNPSMQDDFAMKNGKKRYSVQKEADASKSFKKMKLNITSNENREVISRRLSIEPFEFQVTNNRIISILQYLTSVKEFIIEDDLVYLLMPFLNSNESLSFEALKCLACVIDKPLSEEFISAGGIESLTNIKPPNIASAGASLMLVNLSCISGVMEMIVENCNIPHLVSYLLSLFDVKIYSTCWNSFLFFSNTLSWICIFDAFNQQQGLCKFVNACEAARIDTVGFSQQQTDVYFIEALRNYCEVSLIMLIKKKFSSSQQEPNYKIVEISEESIQESIRQYKQIFTSLNSVDFIAEFLNINGFLLLLKILHQYTNSTFYQKDLLLISGWNIVKICSLSYEVQKELLKKISYESFSFTGFQILFQEVLQHDSCDIKKAALQIIINCVCTDVQCCNNATDFEEEIRKKEMLLLKFWKIAESNIITLINLIYIKNPELEADSIRALASEALLGLVRYPSIKRKLRELPLVTHEELFNLLKSPVHESKIKYHAAFYKTGKELVQRITAFYMPRDLDRSMYKLEVIAESKLEYKEERLLELVRDHLKEKGFIKSFTCLKEEMIEKELTLKPVSLLKNTLTFPTAQNSLNFESSLHPSTVHASKLVSKSTYTIPPPSERDRKKIILKKRTEKMSPEYEETLPNLSPQYQKPLHSPEKYYQSPVMQKKVVSSTSMNPEQITLTSIITDYIRKQHSSCKNPMVYCPTFDFFCKHQCPEENKNQNFLRNCTSRMQLKQINHQTLGKYCAKFDRKFVFSRFEIKYHFQDEERQVDFTSYSFFVYDLRTGQEILNIDFQEIGNNFGYNKGTMNYSDDLLLTDGLIFDMKSKKLVYKMDRTVSNNNGQFHPNNREVVLGSKIYDLRYFKIVHSLPELFNSTVSFNASSTVMFGSSFYNRNKSQNTNRFSVFDARDYSNIAVINTLNPIFDVTPEFNDRYVAGIQSLVYPEEQFYVENLSCQLYEIGVSSTDEEEEDSCESTFQE